MASIRSTTRGPQGQRTVKGKATSTPKSRPPARSVAPPPPTAAVVARAPVPCTSCAHCCTYVAIEIDAPTTARRATQMLFYLYHERVSLYVVDGEFMVLFETSCRQVMPDRRCGVYATRPHICRDYSELSCEVNSEDEGQTIYTPAELMAYLAVHHRRTYRELQKSYAPPDETQNTPGRAKLRLPLIERRFRELRAHGN